MPVVVNLAVEDHLSEAVAIRCLEQAGVQHGTTYGKRGFGWLRKNAVAFNLSAAGIPYLFLTDLDRRPCPGELVSDWLKGRPRHPDFLLRVAVREVEAWLLADRANFADFLGVAESHLEGDYEHLPDPKSVLLRAANRCRKRFLRESIVAETSNGLRQGPDYNGTLSRFVENSWDLRSAAGECPSLRKLLGRLAGLRDRKE